MRLRLPFARIASVLLFAALCAIVAGWALQLLAPRPPIAPVGAVAQTQPSLDLALAGQLFGGAPRPADSAAVAAPSNIQVAGVLAAGPRGVAVLVIDGKPGKPFAVGQSVVDGMTVSAVSADGVELDRSGQAVKLAAPTRSSLAVLTSGPQRPTGGGGGVTSSMSPSLPPLPARPLPPAGAAAPMPETVATVPAQAPMTMPGAQAPGAPPAPPPGVPPGPPPGQPQ